MAAKHIVRTKSDHLEGATIRGDSVEKFGGFIYLTAEEDTVCTDADTWYQIQGTVAAPVLEGFSGGAGGVISYDGLETKTFEMDWHCSLVKAGAAVTVEVGIEKNGVLVASSVMSTVATTLQIGMSGTAALELATSDTFAYVVRVLTTAGQTITFAHYNATIRPFFRN